MTYQLTMAKRFAATACAGLLAATLGAFATTQTAYAADLSAGTAQIQTEVLATQDDSSSDDSSAAKTVEESTNIYRMYNPNTGEHFYTGVFDEAMNLTKVGWNYEGVGWKSESMTNGAAVYRVYNPNAGDHHYTTSKGEKDSLVEAGWNDEGIAFYAADKDATDAKPVYREYNPNAKAGAHNFTLSSVEHSSLVKLGWNDEDIAWYAFEYSAASESIENSTGVYRMYNPNSGEHFYTLSQGEVASLVKAGWSYEDKAWISLDKNDETVTAVPVYRVYNKNDGNHHYTVNAAEKDNLVSKGWSNEGIAFYAAEKDATDSSLIEIYRVYNPNATGPGAHHFTPNKEESEALVELGWTSEGVAWKAKSASTTDAS